MNKSTFWALYFSILCVMIGLAMIAPLLPGYARTLNANGIEIGVIFSAFAFARFFSTFIFSALSDIKGRKVFILSGLGIYALISILYLLVKNVWHIIAIRFIQGTAAGMVQPVSVAVIADMSDKGKESAIMGLFTSAVFVGMAIGPFLGGYFYSRYGINAAFLSLTFLSIIAFLLVIFFYKENRNLKIHRTPQKNTGYIELILKPQFYGLFFFRLLLAINRGVIISFLPLLFEEHGLSVIQIGALISVSVLVMSVLMKPMGTFADKRGKLKMLLYGACFSCLLFALLPVFRTFYEFLVILIVMGIFTAMAQPAGLGLITIAGRGRMGKAMGIYNAALSCGFLIGPLLAGIINEYFGLNYTFILIGIITLIGILIIYSILKSAFRIYEPACLIGESNCTQMSGT